MIPNSKGLQLSAVLHEPKEKTKTVVVVTHGFVSSKERQRYIALADALNEKGIALLRFDFGGCGHSDTREITLSAQVDDLQSVIAFAQETKGYKKIGVLGESLGALTALMSFDEKIQALALWAPTTAPSDFGDFPDEILAALSQKGLYIKTREDGSSYVVPEQYYNELCDFSPAELLGNVTVPVLIVHGEADTKESIENSERAITMLPKWSRLERIENEGYGTHTMTEDMETVITVTVDWFVMNL